MNGLKQKKEFLRAQVKPKISKVRADWSILASHIDLKEDSFIGLFKPLRDEPEIEGVSSEFKACWPRVTDDVSSLMSFYSSQDFEKSNLGFLQPEGEIKEISKKQIQMILVPGLAFDFKGERLGRGKGFYDRYLKDFDGVTVGVCSSDRFLEEPIPVDPKFDVSVQYVLTEQFLYQVNPVRKVV
jgi:5-formyltetrahydrofolate cyclo-ligase